MSKTIIINSDDLRDILKEEFNDSDVMSRYYCHNCSKIHNGCPAKDMDCNIDDDNKVIDFFIGVKFANYMIPFS